jgi:hypothetical protein
MARPVDLVHYFLSYYFISLFVVHAVGKGYRRALWSDVYETMVCFSLSGAVIRALFPFAKKTFYVTPKGEYGEHRRGWKDAVPHLVLQGMEGRRATPGPGRSSTRGHRKGSSRGHGQCRRPYD